jgi:hypothetical protein
MLAIAGSIYTSIELFRVVYAVAILDKIVVRGDSSHWLYRFEMLFSLYTMSYWVCYAAVKVFRHILKRWRE